MIFFVIWYLSVTLLGCLTFPLAYRVFPALADRGYSLSRALGILLWGFVYWLLVSFGVIRNDVGGLLFTLLLIILLSISALWVGNYRTDETEQKGDTTHVFKVDELLAWVKSNIRIVLSVEALFLLAFAVWAFVRASNPEMTSAGGEKWMEVAFINAILHSPTFPPHDPWLSGYAISYYYFGYVLTAMLAMITATPASIAHNLMLSLIFALSVIGAYGLLFNLLAAYWQKKDRGALLGALFGPLMLLIISNVEGFLELLHAYGIGWSGTSNFWTWLNIKDLNIAPVQPYTWAPRYWFWWRASRVVQDFDLRGNFMEIIDEFPFFSYLLGDLHPHVLAMPFGLLAAALALNLYLGGWQGETRLFKISLPVRKQGLALMAVVLGGLAFLNTWDFPIYLAIISGALILSLVHQRGWSWNLIEEFLKFSIPMALASVLLYLPFYVSFSSQAGGILPNVIFPTRGAHLWMMFATLLVPLFLFLVWQIGKSSAKWKTGFLLIICTTLLFWGFSLALGVIAGQTDQGQSFITSQGLTSTREVLTAATLRRLQYGGGLLTLVLLIGVALSFLVGNHRDLLDEQYAVHFVETQNPSPPPAGGASPQPLPFVLMFMVFGGLMVLVPEFVYLRDQFGWRMNTVFKFYYQAWTLWSLAAAFGMAVMFRALRGIRLVLFTAGMSVVMFIGLTYPALALPSKTDNFMDAHPEQRTLDGAAYLSLYNPDDYQAIEWLSMANPGVVAEAVGGGYSEFARVSTYSGLPAVLGWTNHEGQWRGGGVEMGTRMDDISRLYSSSNWDEVQNIIKQYNIRYIYIGNLERSTYTVDERKFSAHLTEFYRQGQVVIYDANSESVSTPK